MSFKHFYLISVIVYKDKKKWKGFNSSAKFLLFQKTVVKGIVFLFFTIEVANLMLIITAEHG